MVGGFIVPRQMNTATRPLLLGFVINTNGIACKRQPDNVGLHSTVAERAQTSTIEDR
jgi:hypothetical protein